MSISAARRAERDRMKARARRLYADHPRAEHYADNLTACSCETCGNPRRYRKGEGRLTIQERRRGDAEIQGFDDIS